MRKFVWAIVVTFVASVPASSATVLNFDNDIYSWAQPQTHNGYTYINGSSYNPRGALTLHDDIGGYQSVSFSKFGGGYFDALAVDMSGIQRAYMTGTQAELDSIGGQSAAGSLEYTNWAYSNLVSFNNFVWNGYRNGVLVATATGSNNGWSMQGFWQSLTQYSFDSLFTGLTSLELVLGLPTNALVTIGGVPVPADTLFCDVWCSGIGIDNLVLQDSSIAPVPLPASLPFLATGLVGLGLFRRKKICLPNGT